MTIMSHLLLVEDDAMLLRGLVRCLRRRIPVVTATTPLGALEILDAGRCFGVLTDFDLGDRERTGAWLLAQAKARNPKLVCAAMTGNALVTVESLGGLAERVFLKPFPMDDVYAFFAPALGLSQTA